MIPEVTPVFIAFPSHPVAKLYYEHHLLDRNFNAMAEAISSGSAGSSTEEGVSLSLFKFYFCQLS